MNRSLQHIISSIISDDPPPYAVKDFITLCQKIALVHLRRKERSGRLLRELIALPLEDIALDCIADLFQRDERGKLLQIHAYFDGIDCATLEEEELLGHVRRLVFSKVNYGLFRIYNEADPSLGKILRNVKLAIQALQNFIEVDRFGEHCIAPSLCETLEHHPPFERAELEQRLRSVAKGEENIPSLLAKISRLLREQEDYCRIVSFITVGYIFRSIYSQPYEVQHVEPEIDAQLASDDISSMIRHACDRVKCEMKQQYVVKKHLDPGVYESYFTIIEQHVHSRILHRDGDIHALFDRMQQVLPELTKEHYKREHKAKLEYLAHLTYKRAIEQLRRDL